LPADSSRIVDEVEKGDVVQDVGKNRASGAVIARVAIVVCVWLGSMWASRADAQMVGPRMGTRAEIQAVLDSLQQFASVATVRDDDRISLQHQVQNVARRLEHGDIWPGDQVMLTISGEDKWTGQFAVSANRTIELQDIEPVDVSNVLYSELEEKIVRQVGRYVRDPRIRVDVLKRVGVLGEVGQAGFYNVTGAMLISDLIMAAGGPTTNADLNKVIFRRLGQTIESGRPRVVWESQSLDELGLISGDEVFVPTKSSFVLVRVLGFVLGTAVAITLIATRL
jgi:protein involved in polysaccharide export with SLBB domain